jgi:hypothetical protein
MRDCADCFRRRVLVAARAIARPGTVVCEVSCEDPAICWEREVLGFFSVGVED